MSIPSQITRLSKNVSDSLDAVAAKGVTVPTGSNSDDLPELIAAISGGVDGDNLGYGSYAIVGSAIVGEAIVG